jgi:hypothetical protein
MADIRYVILSDLHFGAENSMLTSLTEAPATATDTGFSADPRRPSPVLTGLIDGLRQLGGDQDRAPTLILAGDVLDLALSPDQVAATVFRGFARLAYDHQRPAFDPVIHYVPGNHDHHLWEATRENQYVDYIATQPADAELAAPWHTTTLEPAAERPVAHSALLTGLIRSQPGCAAVDVHVSYPNLAVRTPDERRCLVVSHGHFTESIYSLMSQLKGMLYPTQQHDAATDIAALEAENFAWIDFLWSTLGRSGQVGADMGWIYADRSSAADVDTLISNLTAAILTQRTGPHWLHGIEHWAQDTILQRAANHVIHSERGTPSVALTPRGEAGLRGYLQGPVRAQMQREWNHVPEHVSFVYGHTHKPFVACWPLDGFPGAVSIFNTGGWVIDTADPAPLQAGVAVLVNDDLDAAAVEFYRQGPAASPVQVLPPPSGEAPSAWHEELTARIDPTEEPWASLSTAAAQAAAQRHRLQAATISATLGPAH